MTDASMYGLDCAFQVACVASFNGQSLALRVVFELHQITMNERS
jgi:hypothetical protein